MPQRSVVLINPPVEPGKPPRYVPNGLAWVAAALVDEGIPVSIIDMDGYSLTDEQMVTMLRDFDPIWLGIGGMITRYRDFKRLVPMIRKVHPSVTIIVGNSGAATMPHLYFQAGADVAVKGEGEPVVGPLTRHILDGKPLEDIPGLFLPDCVGGVFPTTSASPMEIDSIAMPSWELFPIERYLPQTAARVTDRHVDIQVSRGCPFDCTFCYRQFGRRLRKRQARRIIDEILFIRERYGLSMFSFCDDLFTVDKEWISCFCRQLVDEVGHISWRCLGRVDTVDAEMLKMMADSGCQEIHYGVESASEIILREMNKRITPQQAEHAVELTRAAGIEPICSLIFGMPSETIDTIRESVDFCVRNHLLPFTHFATPYPGTALYEQAKREARITDEEQYILSLGPATDFLINLTCMSDELFIATKRQADRTIAMHLFKQRGFRGLLTRFIEHLQQEGLKKTIGKAYHTISGRV